MKCCFGQELTYNAEGNPMHPELILSFMKSYRSPDITILLKVHIIEGHISEFLASKDNKHGLGKWSEQAFDSAHHDFKAYLAKDMTDSKSSSYGRKLLYANVCYNSKHL